MTTSQIPSRISMCRPFAENTSTTTRSTTISQTSSGGDLNFTDGFGSAYAAPASNGGKYVSRLDMNAIGNVATNDLFYHKCGGLNTFDAAFASAVGGYPKGAVLDYIVDTKLYKVISLIDNNSNNYMTGGVDGTTWAYLNQDEAETTSTDPITIQEVAAFTGSSTVTSSQLISGYDSTVKVLAMATAKRSGYICITGGEMTGTAISPTPYYEGEETLSSITGNAFVVKNVTASSSSSTNIGWPTASSANGWNVYPSSNDVYVNGMTGSYSSSSLEYSVSTTYAMTKNIVKVNSGDLFIVGFIAAPSELWDVNTGTKGIYWNNYNYSVAAATIKLL